LFAPFAPYFVRDSHDPSASSLVEEYSIVFFAFSLFAFLFEASWSTFTVAGVAVSIPVIIHLLNRRRFKIVEWAAMRFLLQAQKKNSRRMRLEQLLLLLARCLLILLLVLAMASVTPWAESFWRWMNPSGGKGLLASSARTHRILVIDGSMSMSVKVGDKTAFETARELAEKIVTDGGNGNGYSVVMMAAPPKRIVPEPSEDPRKVLNEIKNLRMTHGNADLAATLNTTANLLRASPEKFSAKEVYFLTDMQRSNWLSSRPGDLSSALTTFADLKAKAVFVDVGKEGVSNLAITNLQITEPVATTQTLTPIMATLFNYGDAREEVTVRLFVGKAREKAEDKPLAMREVGSTIVRARRSQQTVVTFPYRFPAPGDYVVQVMAAHDELELDDSRAVVVRVKNTVPVVLVNGKPAAEAFDRATEWLRVALNPFPENKEMPADLVFRPKVLTQSQFANETVGDLSEVDIVCLCDVQMFKPAEIRRLETHVRRGGAVVFSLGKQIDLDAYNETLWKKGSGLLPAKLTGVQSAPAGWFYRLTIDPEADRFDPLRSFQDAAREQLLRPVFNTFVQSEPVRASRGQSPRKILGLAAEAVTGKPTGGLRANAPPGGAAIWEWRPALADSKEERDPDSRALPMVVPGRGRVILITTTLNSDWNRWGPSPAFVPFMNELMFHAAEPRLKERALNVGEGIELHLANSGSIEATIETPRDPLEPLARDEDAIKRKSSQPLAEASVIRFGDTEISGIYKMRLGQSPREYLFAVNVPEAGDDQKQSESNLARTTREELEKAYPEWDLQIVRDLSEVKHAKAITTTTGEVVYAPQGPAIARLLLIGVLILLFTEVVLAWLFGHYSSVAAMQTEPSKITSPLLVWALRVFPWVFFVSLTGVFFVLLHNSITGDFLGFMPESLRAVVERAFGVPPPAPGEGSRWRLDGLAWLGDGRSEGWLTGAIALIGIVVVALIYRQEGSGVGLAMRAMMVSLRAGFLLLLLLVFLPQLRLFFERQGWPDVVILIDDSQSMSTLDIYRDEAIKTAVDSIAAKAELTDEEKAELAKALAARAGVSSASRLRLAQTILTDKNEDWLATLLTRRKVRLHVYRCSTRAARLESATVPEEIAKATKAISTLRADPANDSSQLGTAVRQVLNDFRGSSLSAVILLSDGVTTEGEDLGTVAKYAAQMGVPLFFIGIGDSLEQRDLYLHDLQCEESVFVNDRVIFEVKVTAKGFTNLTVPVTLHEKGKDRVLDKANAVFEPTKQTLKVQLKHRPTEPGEKVFVLRVPVQEGEIDRENNAIERTIHVRESKQIKVLFVEGYRRYEYIYLKTLLERESERLKGNKSITLKVALLDADPDFAMQDRTALRTGFPTPFRNVDVHTRDDDLWSYDVIILGDVDPESKNDNKMNEHLKNIADFVRERGGGLVMLAGERFSPAAYRNSPLKDVLPIDITGERAGELAPEEPILENYRLELTPIGRMHPIFRFVPDEKENEEIWGRLKEFFWYSDGFVPKRAAEVLATHPSLKAANTKSGEKHPLIVQQFSGSGRCMFFGVNEIWRWNWREDQSHYNQFWIQTIRYLARSRISKTELRLDRQTPYRRGEPIKVMVRFPDDEKPPGEKAEVKVTVERKAPGKGGDKETRTLALTRLEGSRASFETLLTQTPEGEYRFFLTEPPTKPRPQAECKVLAPPGEMELLRMSQAEMEQAATISQGKFYTLANYDRLIDDLPAGIRVTVTSGGPPLTVWNMSLLFLLAIGILTTEWLVRKQKNLL
jgi:hypothetical protein